VLAVTGFSWALLGLVWVLATVGAFFFNAGEMALSASHPRQVRWLSTQKVPAALRLERLLAHPTQFLVAFMLGKSLLFLGTGLATMWCLEALALDGNARWSLLLSLGLWLAAMQVLGRGWARQDETRRALWLSGPVQIVNGVLSPLVWGLLLLTRQRQGAKEETNGGDMAYLSEEGLRQLIDLNEADTEIKESERRMMARVVELRDTLLREVMVPRIDMVAAPVDLSVPEALDMILAAGHSRIPVYSENVDSVEGILYAKDVLRLYREDKLEMPISQVMRRPYFVPASKKVDTMLREFQAHRTHMAIVVDEFGGTAGLVTIEDLIEEILGEIQDEYDHEPPELTRLSEDLFEFDARFDLDEAARILATDLPVNLVDTMGGFIFSRLGRAPALGDEVENGDWNFRVTQIESSRVKKVQAQRTAVSEPEA